jgi:hypothetical protein
MNEEPRVTYEEDDVLADEIPGAAWNVEHSEAPDLPLAPACPEPLRAVEEHRWPAEEVSERAEVSKILVIVVVGVIGGILGGVTLAKYAIGHKSPAGKSVPVHTVAVKPIAPTAAQVPTPVEQAAPVSSAPTSATTQSKPTVVQASAVQPVVAPAPQVVAGAAQQVLGVYTQKKDKATEVLVFLAAPANVQPEKLANPNRLFFDLPNAGIASTALDPVAQMKDPLLRRVRSGRSESGATRLVFDVTSSFTYKYAMSSDAPYRLTITLQAE